MGGCQNYVLFLGTLNIRGRIIIGTQKGTIILTTTHLAFSYELERPEEDPWTKELLTMLVIIGHTGRGKEGRGRVNLLVYGRVMATARLLQNGFLIFPCSEDYMHLGRCMGQTCCF